MSADASAAQPRRARVVPAGLRLAVVVACAALAYSYSLRTLLGDWHRETPLADLVLVPPLAVLLLAATLRRHRYVKSLTLGKLDLALGTLALAVSLTLLAVGPVLWSKYFWAMRLDLLTLPLYAAAAVLLLFGARALFPFAFGLAFLMLAWPLPYLAALERALGASTRATASAVAALAPTLRLASVDPSSDGSRFLVPHGSGRFAVSVASACSGLNSLVGFLVLAAAGLYFVRGRVWIRLAWLAGGAALVWAFNVVRILAVLGAGRAFGERAAFDVLHPVAGLLALNAAVLVLLRVRRRCGLTFRPLFEEADVDSPIAHEAPPERQATVVRLGGRLALLLAATALVALADGQLSGAARGFANDGRPAIASFAADPVAGPDWRVRRLETIDWAAPYYGRHSSWVRYRLRPSEAQARRGPFTIWLDAIVSPDLGSLDSYSLARCYAFHDFKVELARRIDLGNGVVGRAFVYRTSRTTWHAVAWEWPVLLAQGRVEHERIVLLASSRTRPVPRAVRASTPVAGPVLSVLNAAAPDKDSNRALTEQLREVAAAVVAARVATERS